MCSVIQGGDALNGRAVAVNDELVAAISVELRQTIQETVPCRQGVEATGRQFNRVILEIRIGRRDGSLQVGDVAVGDVENCSRRGLNREQDENKTRRKIELFSYWERSRGSF